ncbi:MAG: M56 family metallopeptidase [Bacteroidales bacterium]|nr:M56 family metallopeptidase [Bacteroidales bacterium]
MGEFLLYIGRSSLYLAVFYAFFLLVMRRTSLFSFNRIVLLAGTAVCFVLPLVRLRTEAAEVAGAAAAGPLTAVGVAAEPLQAAGPAVPALPLLLLLLYVAGAAAVLAFTGLSAMRLARTIRSGHTTQEDGYRLTLVDGGVHSFSWGRNIVMNCSDFESSPAILTHERMHVSRRHSLDIAFFSAVTVLHWFNPLVWITFSELKLLHEYEADEGVINNGIDATQYQLLLVKKAVGEHRFSLANGFRHSKLKNRIAMMIKPHTSGWMRLLYVAVLPVLAALMFACNPAREQEEPAPEQLETKAVQGIDAPKELIDILGTLESMDADKADLEVLRDLLRQYGELKGKDDADKDALRDIWFAFMKKSNEIAKSLKSDDYDVKAAVERGESVPFSLLEVKPTFNGGDANEFSKWVNENLKYPEAAKAAGEQGRVTLQFTIGTDGVVSNVKILRGVSESLDAEALRVVSSSPDWGPGKVNGKPVPVTFTFPVVFKLQ